MNFALSTEAYIVLYRIRKIQCHKMPWHGTSVRRMTIAILAFILKLHMAHPFIYKDLTLCIASHRY